MASVIQTITKPFSRLRNGLVELQRWWPAYVKNDGTGGLSIDPVLYRTNFGPLTNADEGDLNDEANTPGVRVEAIKDDGSAASNDAENSTTFTVTISGAGTLSPMCEVNQAGTVTKFMLIAPSNDTTAQAALVYEKDVEAGGEGWSGALESTASAGPYPVYMTVQEFAEMLDTYRHIGTNDNDKKAWLPHPLVGDATQSVSSSTALPDVDADPRISSNSNWPANGAIANISETLVRASVFMPMMLDNNQFDKGIPNASVNFASPFTAQDPDPDANKQFVGYLTATGEGITRYDPDPAGSDSATIEFKKFGHSGDHLEGKVGGWSLYNEGSKSHFEGSATATGFSNADLSLDSSPSIGPKYRMRMALACFLKNGTYDITDGGALIPYTYDPDRVIGGKTTSTLYKVWNGKIGKGDATGAVVAHDCDAQIYPMFDFIQGPACPAAQGANFDFETLEGFHRSWPNTYREKKAATLRPQPRMWSIRPNPRRLRVFGVKQTTAGVMTLYVERDSATNQMRASTGMPIHVTGMTGRLGTETNNPDFQPDPYAIDLTANAAKGHDMDKNGWMIVDEDVGPVATNTYTELFGDGDSNSVTYQTVQVQWRNSLFGTDVALYRIGAQGTPSTAYITQGRLPGYGSNLTGDTYGIKAPTGLYTSGSASNAAKTPGLGGWAVGTHSSDSNAPVNLDDTTVARPTVRLPTLADSGGHYNSDMKLTPRAISIRAIDDDTFATSPTVANYGGGSLRIPPPIGWDLAISYFTTDTNAATTTAKWAKDGSSTSYSFQDGNEADGHYSRWAYRGISIPFWSFMEPATGRHSWDLIKPVTSASGTWLWGRNRPWPAQERLGTRGAYGPSLLDTATSTQSDGISYDGWTSTATGAHLAAGAESTKLGLTEMGCSPVWLDMEMRAWVPVQQNRMVLIEFDNGVSYPLSGRHSMLTSTASNAGQYGLGFTPMSDDGSSPQYYSVNASGARLYGAHDDENAYAWSQTRRPTFVLNRPSVYVWNGSPFFKQNDLDEPWANSEEWPFASSTLGWGGLGNQTGYGTGATIAEGAHTLRTVFTEAGMNLLVDGGSRGTDINSAGQVWGMTIKVADAMAGGAPENYPTLIKNNRDEMVTLASPNMQVSSKDLQIDYLIMRQIPTAAMVPFNVDTTTQTVTNVAKYASLNIDAENISTSRGMRIKVSLYEPPAAASGRPQAEATTPITGFTDLDPGFAGGIGVIDLAALPSTAIANGFVIRFHFYIPTASQTDLHPINWDAIPIIRSWTLNYDLKPTSAIACIGNSFNGDITPAISTEVGHIISFRGTGTTTDIDRLISEAKFDFGDGATTGWLSFADQTLQSATYDTAHVYSKAGSFNAVAYSRDNNSNESESSSAISVVVEEVNPIALLRAIPSMVRAGQAVRLDSSESYTISSDPDRTIASYTFDFGDGSSTVTGSSPYADHTYASAGEYMATVTATDNDSPANTSTAAKCVVKVLPATLVIPLTLNTMPSKFDRRRRAEFKSTPVLDAVYPEMSDLGQRSDEFRMEGSFLKATANADIDFMEELLVSGALVEFEWEAVNFVGTPTGKKFVGRLTSFDYTREGGRHGETPYTATLVREAGLGT